MSMITMCNSTGSQQGNSQNVRKHLESYAAKRADNEGIVLLRSAVLALLQCTSAGVMLTVQYDRQRA